MGKPIGLNFFKLLDKRAQNITAVAAIAAIAAVLGLQFINDAKNDRAMETLDKKPSTVFNSVSGCAALKKDVKICAESQEIALDVSESNGTQIKFARESSCTEAHGNTCERHLRKYQKYSPIMVAWQASNDDMKIAVPLYATPNPKVLVRKDGKTFTLPEPSTIKTAASESSIVAKNEDKSYVLKLGKSENVVNAQTIQDALNKAVEKSSTFNDYYPRNSGSTNPAGYVFSKDDVDRRTILASCFITKTSSAIPVGSNYTAICKATGSSPMSAEKSFTASDWSP